MSGSRVRPSSPGEAEPRLDDSAQGCSRRCNGCISLLPNCSNPFLPPVTNPRIGKGFLVPPALIGLDRGQHSAESLIGHDVALGDPSRLFKCHEGYTASFVSKLDSTIEVLVDATTSAAKIERAGPRFDQIAPALVVNGEFLRDPPLLLPAEDLFPVTGPIRLMR